MAELELTEARSLIEAAMDRAARGVPAALGALAAEPRRGRQSCAEAPAPTQHPPSPIGDAADSAAPAHSPMASGERRAYRRGALLLTAVLSALGAAGLGWLAFDDGREGGATARPQSLARAPAVPEPVALASPAVVFAAPSAAVEDGEAQARDLIERWRRAWTQRDVGAYLACYSQGFVAADGKSRAAWEAARRKKLAGQSEIRVEIRDLSIERIDRDRLEVQFLQDYVSGSYRESAQPKTLQLAKADGQWRIVGEWQGKAPAASRERVEANR